MAEPDHQHESEMAARVHGLEQQVAALIVAVNELGHRQTGRFDRIETLFTAMEKKVTKEIDDLNADIDTLTSTVEAETTVDASAVTLLTGLSAKIAELTAALQNAGNDPAAIQAVRDRLKALGDKLAASTTTVSDALVANTTAAPA